VGKLLLRVIDRRVTSAYVPSMMLTPSVSQISAGTAHPIKLERIVRSR
jgi:hypothetical protein